MQRAHLIIHGLVQGVFFRSNTKREAMNLNLKGYVKNLPDGTAEVIAEGSEANIKHLIEFCKKSPEASQVSKVDVKFMEPKNEFQSFEVKY